MRIFNRLLAFVVAVALLGTCVIVIVEVIAARSDSAPVIIHWPSILHWGRNTWKATSVELASCILVAAGLLLLIPQLIRRRPTRLAIDTSDLHEAGSPAPATDAALTRKGVAFSIRNAIEDVDGITRTRVKVGRRRIRIRAVSSATEAGAVRHLEPDVSEVAGERLAALRLRSHLRVSVDVRGSRNGVS